MDNLMVIEKELVPVYETSTGEKVVDGRELHAVLKSKQDFSTWVKKRLSECDAEENTDYELLHNFVEQVSGGKYRIDYTIKLDTAKEMAMLERNDKGKQVRRYFIEVEKKYKAAAMDLEQLDPQTKLMNLLVQSISKQELEQKQQAEQIAKLEDNVKHLEAKVTTHNEDYYTIAGYASLRGMNIDILKAVFTSNANVSASAG